MITNLRICINRFILLICYAEEVLYADIPLGVIKMSLLMFHMVELTYVVPSCGEVGYTSIALHFIRFLLLVAHAVLVTGTEQLVGV